MFASEFDHGFEDTRPIFESPPSISENKKSKNRFDSVRIDERKPKSRAAVPPKNESRDKVYQPSLFRSNPQVPPLESNENVVPIKETLFSATEFRDLADLHPHMVANLEQNLSLKQITKIQEFTIPVIRERKDALVRSQTGSGKTLAYAIPIVQDLQNVRPKLSRKDGVKAVIVLPTRELAIQTYEWFIKLVKPFTWLVPGLIIGGEKRKSEKARLRKGITILIGTPGRLLDHAKNTKNVTFNRLKWLIIDEADRLFELGYEKYLRNIIEIIDLQTEQRRQTVLLSATLSKEVEKLASLSLHEPVTIDVVSETDISHSVDDSLIIPDSLSQYFVVVPPKLRLVTLASLLLDKCSNRTNEGKILVFMGTQAMVDYHTELFATVLSHINIYKLHGKMTQTERTDVFKMFRSNENGVLMCSDVAARGLDLPQVDWIIQYTAPVTFNDYVHRVGRTARVGLKGSAMMFLAPHEIKFASVLRDYRVNLNEVKMEIILQKLVTLNFDTDDKAQTMESAATKLHVRFENALLDQKLLHSSGCQAFVSWARFYASYPKDLRDTFSFKELHLGHYAKSFALKEAPKVISGIGKPKNIRKSKSNAEFNKLTFEKRAEKTKNLYDDGVDSSRKRKMANLTEVTEFESGLIFKTKKTKRKTDL